MSIFFLAIQTFDLKIWYTQNVRELSTKIVRPLLLIAETSLSLLALKCMDTGI